jgi:hypothetical protein
MQDVQRPLHAAVMALWQDLVRFSVARCVGVEETMQVAKVYLINWHEIRQQPCSASR